MAASGICAMCTAIDVIMGVSQKMRDNYLRRLNVYTGAFTSAAWQRTTARGWELTMKLHNPGKLLYSFFLKKI